MSSARDVIEFFLFTIYAFWLVFYQLNREFVPCCSCGTVEYYLNLYMWYSILTLCNV